MGLLRSLISLPVAAPIKGTLWVADKIHEAADQEVNAPAAIRKTLQNLEDQLLQGEIDEATYDEAETLLLRRLQAMS